MKNYQLVKIEAIKASNFKEGYILLHDMRFDVKVKLNIQTGFISVVDTAITYLALRGFTIEAVTRDEVNRTNYLLLTNYEPISSNLISVNDKKMKEMELR